jgi:hypothetical protein
MLTIKINKDYCLNEVKYIFNIIFSEILEISWKLEHLNSTEIIISCDINDNEIRLPNTFFCKAESFWLNSNTLPQGPIKNLDLSNFRELISLIEYNVPVIFGNNETELLINQKTIKIPIDIFGSSFFMITRYEEVINNNQVDIHGRFPAYLSFAALEGFLERPIIDEYIEILWFAIKSSWPSLSRKVKTNLLQITCDIDSLYDLNSSFIGFAKGFTGDIIKRKSPQTALKNIKKRFNALNGVFEKGSHYQNIKWLMDVNEKEGNSVLFYVLTGGTHFLDGNYNFTDKYIVRVLREIIDRGHKIGIHPSYITSNNPDQLKFEVDRFLNFMDKWKISISELYSRQHYLKWDAITSAIILDKLGIDNDSTLGYADKPGFRCGTSRSFSMYDLLNRRKLNLTQTPLVLMETSVFSPEYLGLGNNINALEYMKNIKNNSLKLSGKFTLLWHNSSFSDSESYNFYKEIIKNK